MTHLKIFRRQTGVSLLEVLIAVVILAFGLLGLAGLQMSSLRNNQSALERSMAVVESYSIADAMRVDRNSAINHAFDLSLDTDPTNGSSFAAAQLTAWRSRLTDLLGPDATGGVACNGTICTITIQWNDQRGSEGAAEHQIQTEIRL